MMPPGTTLSRWTMSYFGAAVLFLMLAEFLLSAGWWRPSFDVTEPRALIVVHCITIGWLGLLMMGALFQFTPVLTGLSLPTERLNLPCLIGSVLGLCLLLSGFDRMDVGSPATGAILFAAAIVLLITLCALAGMLFAGLWQAIKPHAAAPFVMIGLVCFILTIGLGACFAVSLSGLGFPPRMIEIVTLLAPFHAGFGLVGWMTFAAIGVTYKLLPMFLLSDDVQSPSFVRGSGLLALAVLAIASITSAFDTAWAGRGAIVSGVMFQFCIAAYLVDLVRIYRGRRRKSLELNTLGSIPAFVLMATSAPLFVIAMVFDLDSRVTVAAAYLFVFGWLTGLGLAQLLKIVPFLTWIEAFGPLLGRRPTPRLGELINDSRSITWLGVFYLAVLLAAAAIAAGSDLAFQAAALCQALSTGALAVEFVRARSLANVPLSAKSPPLSHPALFHASNPPER